MSTLRLVLAIGLVALILLLPPTSAYDSYIDTLRHTSMTLKGLAPYADVAQDFYGFRALVTNQDPYARLTTALKTIGVDWKAGFSSTHPPTAFLLVAPVAFLPWPISSMAWAWLMLICLCVSLRFGCGYPWDVALLVTATALYWPPISTSFDQITIVWLFGLAMAYYFRNDRPFLSGVWIAVASFTKLLPALLLVPFLLRRNVDAIKGFIVTWFVASGILLLLSPKTILHYVTANRSNTAEIIARLDNGAFLLFLYRKAGTAGAIVTAIALLLLVVLALYEYQQESGGGISKDEWNLYAFLAVLVMPITWIFSIAPLLPNVLLLLHDLRPAGRLLVLGALLSPMLVLPWGTQSTGGLFGFFILAGAALVLKEMDWASRRRATQVSSE